MADAHHYCNAPVRSAPGKTCPLVVRAEGLRCRQHAPKGQEAAAPPPLAVNQQSAREARWDF